MRSETQPKNGRVRPLVTRSNVSAAGTAAMVTPRITTVVFASIPNALAKLVNWVMTMRPPVDIIDIITNISQNTGDLSISPGATPGASVVAEPATSSARGERNSNAPSNPTTAKIMPNAKSVCW